MDIIHIKAKLDLAEGIAQAAIQKHESVGSAFGTGVIELHRGRDGQTERQQQTQIGVVDETHNRLTVAIETVQRGSHPAKTAFVVEEDVVRQSDGSGQVGVPA